MWGCHVRDNAVGNEKWYLSHGLGLPHAAMFADTGTFAEKAVPGIRLQAAKRGGSI